MGVFNSPALKALGVDETTPSPDGGRIEQKDGRLTGYMEENAFVQYLKKVPMPSIDQLLTAYAQAQQEYASFGITTVQEGMLARELIPLYQALLASNLLKLDVVGYADIAAKEEIKKAFAGHIGQYKGHFKLGGYKNLFRRLAPRAHRLDARALQR